MMYYIERPNTWKAANKKCAEVQEFVDTFKNCLILDELSRDALIAEIRRKIAELNEAYPRTKKLIVSYNYSERLSCYPEGREPEYEQVFAIRILPVRQTYRFAENASVLEKGGAQ